MYQLLLTGLNGTMLMLSVGNGLARSVCASSFAEQTAWKKSSILHNFGSFYHKSRSNGGSADGMSKPIPYDGELCKHQSVCLAGRGGKRLFSLLFLG